MIDLQKHFSMQKWGNSRTLGKTSLYNKIGEGFLTKQFFLIYSRCPKHKISLKRILEQIKRFKFAKTT